MPADLNALVTIPSLVAVEPGGGGLPRIVVTNQYAEAHIYLHGAHITHFQPRGEKPVLWVSAKSHFAEGKAIRGGIPICWPWFGANRTNKDLPMHGLARSRSWTPVSASQLADGRTRVELSLTHDATTLALWPYEFVARLTMTVGKELDISLTTSNTGFQPFVFDDALHTYFSVGDVRQASVEGLEGSTFYDKVSASNQVQNGAVTISGETDRVYTSTGKRVIHDPVLKRSIHIAGSGSNSTIVWNPWIAKAQAMADFGDNEWPSMLCVETANCLTTPVMLVPGTEHTTTVRIGVQAQ